MAKINKELDGDWRMGAFITDSSTGEALITPERQENFLITVFPEIDVEGVKFNRSDTAVLATGFGINAALEGDKLEAAWTLVKWLEGKEVSDLSSGDRRPAHPLPHGHRPGQPGAGAPAKGHRQPGERV